MGQQPSGGPVRDDTGLVVGSPEWLEAQRRVERGETPGDLRRKGTWQIVLGSVIVAIATFTAITLIRGENTLGIRLRPSGYLTFFVAPLIVGGYVVILGLRQRRQRREHRGP